MLIKTIFLLNILIMPIDSTKIKLNKNLTEIAIGLSEISKAVMINSLSIFYPNSTIKNIINIIDFIKYVQKFELKTCFFDDIELYLKYIEFMQINSMETSSLIFTKPMKVVKKLKIRNLAHRLNLFMFYWEAKALPNNEHSFYFEEPLRVAIITNPRESVLRVYYNQATPYGDGCLQMVNWYDSNSLGLFRVPLLPNSALVYKNFQGRTLLTPVIHSPPWNFVEYANDSVWTNDTNEIISNEPQNNYRVIGGRDYNLLKLLADKMNFRIEYIDPPERTQGATPPDSDNLTFSGGLGILQKREADLLLGDVAITSERKRVVEFSFFTLADSGAFATHAPKRLSEALALVRPFRWEVWPLLLFTIVITGPAFYFIIAVPFWWNVNTPNSYRFGKRSQNHYSNEKISFSKNKNVSVFHENYLREMNYGVRKRDLMVFNAKNQNFQPAEVIPNNLLEKCIWFTITIFLKQSCNQPYAGNRAKFVSTILWLAASYVLADVYSAQLTSQLARPAREAPINTLQRLEFAMKYKGYQLYVERQSSSLGTLENGTEIFKRLYNLMKHQRGRYPRKYRNESYFVSTVEEGINLIINDGSNAILGGRETLFFNMKRHGIQNFQLSEKLYTRYSAVAVQHGCPFLESLNEVLIHLFEGGILEKMTNAEYEKMFELNKNKDESLKTNDNEGHQKQKMIESKLQPINLRTLQGAFYALGIGFTCAGLIFLLEIKSKIPQFIIIRKSQFIMKKIGLSIFGAFKKILIFMKTLILEMINN